MLQKKKNQWFYAPDGTNTAPEHVPVLDGANETQAAAWERETMLAELAALRAKLASGSTREAAKNVEQSLEGSILTLRIDLSQDNGKTKGRLNKTTGQTVGGGNVSIATTHGFLPVNYKRADGKEVQIGVNVFAK